MMVRRFGVAPRQSLLLPYTPVVDGRKPVITDARDGLHADDEQYARVNNVPLFAKRVIFGSLIGADSLYREFHVFISSTVINNTSVRAWAKAAPDTSATKKTRNFKLMLRILTNIISASPIVLYLAFPQ